MIANNIFRAIGDFCTNVLFKPFDFFRFMDSWWASNFINIILFLIGFAAMIYWLEKMVKFKRQGSTARD